MVDHLRSDEAKMVALFIEAVLYGIYLVSLGFVLVYVLRDGSGKWRRPSGVRVGMLTVALILWINSTLNLAWGLMRQMRVYIFKPQTKKPTWIDLAKVCEDYLVMVRIWIILTLHVHVAIERYCADTGG